MNKLNIIYMHTHDSGRFWSPYGYAVPTKNIQEFAKESTVFRQCYCAGPTCSPSRSALLTGYNPHSNGMQGLASRGWQLDDYDRHLVRFLRKQDYLTTLCGIQHVAPEPHMIGYDRILGSQDFSMDSTESSMEDWDYLNTEAACGFLSSYQDDKPFFLSMGWFNTHREYPKASKTFNPDYIQVPFPLYDCDTNRRDMADYHESVQVVDNCFGMIMDSLKNNNLLQNTIIILTTDHGIAFPKMKCTLFDSGIGVAFLFAYPGNPMKGRATDALVSQMDIFPTLCELLDVDKPDWLEGHSLVPLLEGRTQTVRGEIFSEVTYHAAYEPKRCIRTDRYKLIRLFDNHMNIVPANIDEAVSKSFLMEHGYGTKCREKELLFDLWLDASESDNLIGNPAYAIIYKDLFQRLEAWMLKTHDPLLLGGSRVPKPKGARVNVLCCDNPRLDEYEEAELSDYDY